MLLDKPEQGLENESTSFSIGQKICVTKSPYKNFLGTVKEILTDSDKLTGSEASEIRCELEWPTNQYIAKELLEQLSERYGTAINSEDVTMADLVFSPEDLRPVRHVRLYQIDIQGIDRNDSEHPALKYLFRGYENMKAMGLIAPPGELYHIVYDGMLGTDFLEDISYIFNVEHPQGFKGRSLTQSDIVELYDNNSSQYYYADFIGYVEIPSFQPGGGVL